MPAFYLTFLAVLLAGFGARDQVTIAALSKRQGGRPGILVVALLSALATAVFAAFAAHWMLGELPPPARTIFAAIALGMAGGESLLLAPRREFREPTHSLGALLIVLLAHQVTDAARFIVFGMGVGMGAPLASGAAGLLGGAVLVCLAWAMPAWLGQPLQRWIRRLSGAVLLCVAGYLLLSQMHIV